MSSTGWTLAILLLVAGLASGVTWYATKEHYNSPPTPAGRDTVMVSIRTTDTIQVNKVKAVHDTILVGEMGQITTYAKMDTTLDVELEIAPDSADPVKARTSTTLSVKYDVGLGEYSMRQTFSPVRVPLPVRVETQTFVVEKEPMFWIQPSLLWQGGEPGAGFTFGFLRYSLGRKWTLTQPPAWEFGVRFGI